MILAVGDVTVSIDIAAAPRAVYDLVSDLPRMGEWSPECERCVWTGGAAGPAVGAHFVGYNRNGRRSWSTKGTVAVADAGREFAFEITSVMKLPVARWTYRIEPTPAGCRVTESTVDRRGRMISTLGRIATGVGDRTARNRDTMTHTLQELKRTAEART